MNHQKEDLYNLIKSNDGVLDFIQESSLSGVRCWQIDQFELEWLNPNFAVALGYNSIELPSTLSAWKGIVNQGDLRKAIDDFFRDFKDVDYRYDKVVRYQHKDGSTIWIRCNAIVLPDSKDDRIMVLGTFTNVTREQEIVEQLRKRDKHYEDILAKIKETQHQLIISENQFRTAFEDSAIGMALVSLSGKWLKVNRQLCKITGYTREELLSGYMGDIMHPDDVDKDALQVKQLIEGKIDNYRMEKRYLHKNGSLVWIVSNRSLVRDSDNRPLHFVSQIEDITKRKHDELELENTLHELSAYKYALDESAIVDITDNNGIIRFVNYNFCKISKYEEHELIGKDHSMLSSEYHGKEFVKELWRTLQEGKVWKGELKNKAKDGSFYWVNATIVPFLNQFGKPYQFISIRFDITHRKRVQEEIITSQTLLKSSIESYQDVLMFSINSRYQYLLFNNNFKQATFQAYGTMVAEGLSMLDSITNDEDREKAKVHCDRALAGDGHVSIDVYGELTRQYFETRYYPIYHGNDEIIGVTVISANVTERKRAEDEIVRLNQELEAFSYSVAHDLRSPLRIIDGYSGILLDKCKHVLHQENQRCIEIIIENTRRMGDLIDDLLNFARMGQLEVSKQLVDPGILIKKIIEEQRILSGKKDIKFLVRKLESLNCDINLMSHVFTNLISNSVKYSQKNSEPLIEIDSCIKEGHVVYSIHDNGVGFDMKYAHNLFGVFQRLHKQSEFEGTGVGLAIVKRIISKHGGRVWAEATLHQGATFYFSLPA